MLKFIIEDERHAATLGEFASLEDAVRELRRVAILPWDQIPNAAPCANWRECGRCYEIVAYDAIEQSWRELRRVAGFEISANGVEWSKNFEDEVNARPE